MYWEGFQPPLSVRGRHQEMINPERKRWLCLRILDQEIATSSHTTAARPARNGARMVALKDRKAKTRWAHSSQHRTAAILLNCTTINQPRRSPSYVSLPCNSSSIYLGCHRFSLLALRNAIAGAGHHRPAHQDARHRRKQDQNPRPRCTVRPPRLGSRGHEGSLRFALFFGVD